MPHPQDVAVPSLPLSETLALAIKLGVANVDFEEQAEIDGFLHTFGNACYEAGRAAGRASAEPEGFRIALHEWAVAGWRSEVQNRPLVNIHRKRLDDFWRHAIRHAGGDPDTIVGPSHDELLAAAPTPTASIAPKAEGEADENFVSRWTRVIRDMPSTYEHPAAPKAEGEALHKFINAAAGEGLVLDGVDAADLYIELWPAVGEPSHPQAGAAEFNAAMACAKVPAAPVAQAAAGAREPIRKLLAEVLLFFHDCSESIRCIDRVVDLEERIGDALARPEADADRASGGGANEGAK